MIVVDTDVIACAVIRRDPGRTALGDAVDRRDSVWVAPPLWLSEFRNVLASYIRFRGMNADAAIRLSIGAEEQLAGTIPVASDEVLHLVAVSGCTAYDCEFVAAAKRLCVKLVTGDHKLAAAFPDTAMTMEEFVGS